MIRLSLEGPRYAPGGTVRGTVTITEAIGPRRIYAAIRRVERTRDVAVPAAETMIRLEDSRDPDVSIVVTAYQWKWHYKYQDEGVEFYSSLAQPSREARNKGAGIDPFAVDNYLLDVDRPLVVPKGKKVRILLTSNDVNHAWWVPDLAIKRDAIPGIVNEAWFRPEQTGTFRGQCAELCGKDHGYMPIVVEVVEPDAYQAWVETRNDSGAQVAQTETRP